MWVRGETRENKEGGGIDKVVAVSLCQHSPETAQLLGGRRVEGHEQSSDLVTSVCTCQSLGNPPHKEISKQK